MCVHENASFPASARSATRRRSLWQLPIQYHCPVVGVCLPLASLRRVVDKSLGGTALADDYELHVGVVNECRTRNPVSERLQRVLNQRHAAVIARFRHARSDEALLELWRLAMARGEVSGAFWAAITHPVCSAPLMERLFREIHMHQHQAGAGRQADIGQGQSLIHENAVLTRELARVQSRTTKLLAERASEIDRLRAELSTARARLGAVQQQRDQITSQLEAIRESVRRLDSRERLTKVVAELQARLVERPTPATQTGVAEPHRPPENPEILDHGTPILMAQTPTSEVEGRAHCDTSSLANKTVLCVGGRPSSEPVYRKIIEQYGASYLHHDGGIEENMGRLVTSMGAADLVICQTGCISHDAYWRVKNHCRRTGKPCIYLDNPSASSLGRKLSKVLESPFDQVPSARA